MPAEPTEQLSAAVRLLRRLPSEVRAASRYHHRSARGRLRERHLAGLEAKLRAAELLPLDRQTSRCPGLAELLERIAAGQKKTFQLSKREVHLPQIESIGSLLERSGLLGQQEPTLVLELGAGKGLMARAFEERYNAQCVLVDTRAPAATYDRQAVRVQADVANCRLDELLEGAPGRVLVLGKHLCHNGSDRAIEAICGSQLVGAVALAPCCHPQIKWELYCNTPFLERLGLNRLDLGLMLKLVFLGKYQTLASRDCKKWEELRAISAASRAELALLSRCAPAGRREPVGRRVLEQGRAELLARSGFEVKLVQYTEHSVSPDNLMLLASRRPLFGKLHLPPAPTGPALPVSGLLLHLNCAAGSSLPGRVVDYLLERPGQLQPIQAVQLYCTRAANPMVPGLPPGLTEGSGWCWCTARSEGCSARWPRTGCLPGW